MGANVLGSCARNYLQPLLWASSGCQPKSLQSSHIYKFIKVLSFPPRELLICLFNTVSGRRALAADLNELSSKPSGM